MDRLSDAAIEIINTLHRERIDYNSEYLPLIDAVNRLSAYEDIELEPNEIEQQLMNFSSFLSEMTHSHMSKTNYTVEAMVSEANDCFERVCDECADRGELADFKELGSIEHIRELIQAEKDRRMVVLPCKVGDTVYRVIRAKDGGGHIATAVVSGIHMADTVSGHRYKKGTEYIVLRVDGYYCDHVDVKKFGETVFLTREEADAALKGGGKGDK